MKKIFLSTVIFLLIALGCSKEKKSLDNRQGKAESEYLPFNDEKYQSGAQIIPGKVYCAYYDFGGEGVAYHDADSINQGSGKLNPDDGSYLHTFRMKEGVDISYTKENIDDSEYNFFQPPMDLLYVGWTVPGEWLNYTVNVVQSGIYNVSLLYTSNQGGKISLSVNGKQATPFLTLFSTFNQNDKMASRQWHHWYLIENLALIKLEKGIHVLTLTTEETGQMNYAYLDFKLETF
ncbi:MAG: carbohydrate-binding protein [Dysgonamonadaceae bacterium]|jgi:hypothetical protein|nr:carbohydrate-binding protein [Dysgonamonadaceae bacterium]